MIANMGAIIKTSNFLMNPSHYAVC